MKTWEQIKKEKNFDLNEDVSRAAGVIARNNIFSILDYRVLPELKRYLFNLDKENQVKVYQAYEGLKSEIQKSLENLS